MVVGFNKGSYRNNTITVASVQHVKLISKNTKFVVALLEQFIRDNVSSQGLKPYDRVKQTGFWRYLIVRESKRTEETLIEVVCRTEGL